MEYWGARVTPIPSAIAHYVPSRYVEDVQQDFEFTRAPGDKDADVIETINQKIMNQHPEDISLLADRWQNAHDLLESIKQQLLEQSTLLYEQHWRDAQARDLFMEKGPGQTLAYLDDWIDATLSNVEALRALVGIATESRERMETMYADYERDVMAARDLDWWDEAQEDLQFWQGWSLSVSPMSHLPVIGRDTSGAKEQEARSHVDAVRDRYNRDAQELAREIAVQYADTWGKVSGGHGALFEPMNVVFNPPHDPFPSLPNAPATPPPVAPPATPPVPPPPAPTAPAPPPVTVPTPPTATPPPPGSVPTPGGVPTAPVVPVASAEVPPVVPIVPASQVGPRPTAPPTAPPAVGPGARTAGVPQPGTGPGALPPGTPRSGVQKGVLKGGGGKGATPALPPGVPPPGRTLSRNPAAPPGGKEQERRGTRAPGGPESAFAGPTPPTSPPVLGNPRQTPARPERKERSPVAGPRSTDPPQPGTPAGAVPPVLHAPPPSRGTPAVPPPQRRAPTRPGTPTPGAEWIGADTARVRANDPVLGRPTPPAGQRVSRLEEVPEALRRRRTEPAAAGPEKKRRPNEVAPDLAPRRAAAEGPEPAETTLDEDAFHVETPGGGVLANQQERTTYRPEPPAALGREST